MSIATNADLLKFRADIMEHGVSSWSSQLTMAEADVLELIKTEWFVEAAKGVYGYGLGMSDYQTIINSYDQAKLNTVLLVNIICYRAMAWYIYPSLTRDTDDGNDAFSRRAERYKAFYDGEWERVKKMELYDFSGDSVFSAFDRANTHRTVMVVRA
jgi:hypothetical protein